MRTKHYRFSTAIVQKLQNDGHYLRAMDAGDCKEDGKSKMQFITLEAPWWITLLQSCKRDNLD